MPEGGHNLFMVRIQVHKMRNDKTVIIFHGTMGSPHGNWFPWLKLQLEAKGCNAIIPALPTPEGQSLEVWKSVAEDTLEDLDPAKTVLIGHSLGAIFALRLAEQSPFPYKAVFAVCPFDRPLGIEPYDSLNSSFVSSPLDWSKTILGANKIYCFAGDNDPYVPLSIAQDVAQKAKASLQTINGGGHLNEEFGYKEFPLLFDGIMRTLNDEG